MIRHAFLIAAAALALGSKGVAGQTPAPIRTYPFQDMREDVLKDTHPTTAQLQRVDSIASAYLDRMHALDPVMRGKPLEERRKNLLDLQVEQAKDIRGILTDEQRRAFDKNYQAWATRRGVTAPSPTRQPN